MKKIIKTILVVLFATSQNNLWGMQNESFHFNKETENTFSQMIRIKLGGYDIKRIVSTLKYEKQMYINLKESFKNMQANANFTKDFKCSSVFEFIILGKLNSNKTCSFDKKSINEAHPFFGTPLKMAVLWDRLDPAQKLIENGANIAQRSGRFRSNPLQIAAIFGKLEFIKLFIGSIRYQATKKYSNLIEQKQFITDFLEQKNALGYTAIDYAALADDNGKCLKYLKECLEELKGKK